MMLMDEVEPVTDGTRDEIVAAWQRGCTALGWDGCDGRVRMDPDPHARKLRVP